jgi:penicillin-binding protein 2
MEGRVLNIRLAALGALAVLLSFAVIFRLYDLQIVNGDSYYRQSEKKITRYIDVEAGRGEILDRYGRKLVTNRLSYNISFDSLLFAEERKNDTILELFDLCKERNIPYENGLPIARVGNRYVFTDNETGQRRLKRYLAGMGWDAELGAEEIIKKMCQTYSVNEEMSGAYTLGLCAVRYELDLRSVKIGLNIAEYVFCKDVDTELISIIKERSLSGVKVVTETVRNYETEYAAHILGRVGPIFEEEYPELKEKGYAMDDTVGKDGAEKTFESWLRGKQGRRVEELNSSGKVTSVMYAKEAQPGGNVVLTIDIKLQEAVEKALESRINEIKALGEEGSSQGAADVEGGAAVVLNVKTGEVLAMASYPTYNLSAFSQDYSAILENPLKPMYNRALMGAYAPGSTFKMVTTAAAMEEGIITRKTRITDQGIYMYYAPSYTPMCEVYLTSRSTHGTINIVEALRVSCNYFFYEVGRLTGIERMNEYSKFFGLGERTGIELEGETKGTLAGPESKEAAGGIWYPGDTIAAAIGQSDNLFTPLQLASYVAALANGGVRQNVHLLKSVKSYDYNGTIFETENTAAADAGLSEETLAVIFEGMLAVSKTGSSSAVFGNYPINVASKTGTAQIGKGSPNGVFVAFAPYEDPEIAIAIVVEHAGKGSRIGNIARDTFDAYFRINDSFEMVIAENELIN